MSHGQLSLRPYQKETRDALFKSWISGMRRPAVVLPTGCHRAGQGVLMYDGSVRAVEDVRTGDRVMGPDSTPRTVLALARGTGAMMEIRPVKGDPWVVNDAHVMTLVELSDHPERCHPSGQRGGTIRDVDLRDWWQWSRYRKHTHKLFRVPVDFPERPAPGLDPYFLGVVLGDGSLSRPYALSITTADPEITELCEQTAAQYGVHIRRDDRNMIGHNFTSGHKRNGRRGGQNALLGLIRDLGLCPIACADRFVPEIYKLGSRDVRRQVLAGLIDSDGALSGGGYDYGSKSERLANDVAFIARSLGLAAYVTKRPSGHFRVSISGDCTIIPVRIPRKAAPARNQIKDVLRTGFQVIPTGTVEPFYGFFLNGDQRYLLDDFTVTHNSGKTVIFSDLAREFHSWRTAANGDNIGNGGERSLILVHRDELADQALTRLGEYAPDLWTGKIKAEANDLAAPVTVASVQTLSRENRLRDLVNTQEAYGEIGLIVTDECHHGVAPSYRKIYEAFPHALNAGVTATLERGDGVGLGSTWDDVVYSRSVLWMISRGYLVDVIPKAVRLDQLDLSRVRKSAGDFQAKALGTAMVDAGSPSAIAAALRKYAPDRRSIVFCPDVFSAMATASAIGPSAAVVTGTTPREDRRLVYKRFETGDLRTIVNCMVLTEGFDAPWADCVVIARPTQSAPLFAQMAGRGLRTWPGKENCLLLDVSGTGGRLSTLIDLAPGEVDTVRPGESLADAAIRYETDQNTVIGADSIAFALKHRDLDLFAASSKAWLRTDGGVLFIPVGQGQVFLWPAGEGRWDVGAAPVRGKWRRMHSNLPLGTAQAWAETEADDLTAYTSRSGNLSSRWRKEAAQGPMIGRARRYGYVIPENPTKGQLSDLIAIGEASERFDHEMRKIK